MPRFDPFDDIDNYSSDPDMYLDVPFVPTEENVVKAMLALAEVGPKDLIYDLGSGDGRILIAAAKEKDARGIGIDIDPTRIADAMEYAGWSRVEHLVDFIEDDIFTVDFSAATVVTLYLLQSINVQLRPRLLSELRPGTRIVSHAFDMGDWKADERLKVDGVNVYKWVVPARVAGVLEWEGRNGRPYRVKLRQQYQKVDGKAWLAGKPAHLESADLCGGILDLKIREDETSSPESFTLNFADDELQSVLADGVAVRVLLAGPEGADVRPGGRSKPNAGHV